MNLKINSIKVEHFKGVEKFDWNVDNGAILTAGNGAGKSTIADAILFMLSGNGIQNKKLNLTSYKFDVPPFIEMKFTVDGELHESTFDGKKFTLDLASGLTQKVYMQSIKELIPYDIHLCANPNALLGMSNIKGREVFLDLFAAEVDEEVILGKLKESGFKEHQFEAAKSLKFSRTQVTKTLNVVKNDISFTKGKIEGANNFVTITDKEKVELLRLTELKNLITDRDSIAYKVLNLGAEMDKLREKGLAMRDGKCPTCGQPKVYTQEEQDELRNEMTKVFNERNEESKKHVELNIKIGNKHFDEDRFKHLQALDMNVIKPNVTEDISKLAKLDEKEALLEEVKELINTKAVIEKELIEGEVNANFKTFKVELWETNEFGITKGIFKVLDKEGVPVEYVNTAKKMLMTLELTKHIQTKIGLNTHVIMDNLESIQLKLPPFVLGARVG